MATKRWHLTYFCTWATLFWTCCSKMCLRSIANPPLLHVQGIFLIFISNSRWHIVHSIHKSRNCKNTNKRNLPITLGVNTIVERPSFVGWQSTVIITKIVTKPILTTPSKIVFSLTFLSFPTYISKKNLNNERQKNFKQLFIWQTIWQILS